MSFRGKVWLCLVTILALFWFGAGAMIGAALRGEGDRAAIDMAEAP